MYKGRKEYERKCIKKLKERIGKEVYKGRKGYERKYENTK